MLPTPYAYGVGNTYVVDNVLYTVGTYSVGDILWTSRIYTVGYICCGNILWTTQYILWGTYTVDIYCGRHSIYCGSHKYIYTVGHMLWTTSIYDVGNMVVHSIYAGYPHHIPTVYDCIYCGRYVVDNTSYDVGIYCGRYAVGTCRRRYSI